MKSFTHIAREIGELVDEKNAAYGSSFERSGDFLRLLWPGGVPADRLDDALLMARIFDKQMRIATDQDAFGESPYRDIAGYGLLGATYHDERKNRCGSASGGDAVSRSQVELDSAAPSASLPTTTPTSEPSASISASSSSERLESSSPSVASPDAIANAAMELVRRNVVDLGRRRNKRNLCAATSCPELIPSKPWITDITGSPLAFHSDVCRFAFIRECAL